MVHLALVGGAHIHVPNFIKRVQARDDVAVSHVWDHDPDRAQRRAAALGARVTPDLEAIWADAAIQAVIIGSETDRHEALVLGAATVGKAVFVEKPLAADSDGAYCMAEAIERAGVVFQTGYFMRGDPIYRFLRRELQRGAFGQVTRLRMSNCHAGALGGWFDTEWRWMADVDQAGVGAFGDLGAHVLDIMLWLLGDVTSATAAIGMGTGRYPGCDETGEGLLRFRSGAIGSLAAAWDDIANPVTLVLSGTEAHATVFNGALYYQNQGVAGADGKTPWTDLPAPLPHAFDLFLDALTGQADVPLVSPREAAERVAVMAAMYAGARRGEWVTPETWGAL